MSYYESNSISYSTSLTPDDEAYSFLERQANKSGTIRTLLNDAVKVCADMDDYMDLPEAVRLRKYFNYVPQPTVEQARTSMLSVIDGVQADPSAMHCLAVVARYVHLWRKYADSLVPAEHRRYAMGFIVHSADDCVAHGEADEPEIAFAVHLKAFLTACDAGRADPYTAQPKRLTSEFVRMVFVLFDVYDLMSDSQKQLVRHTPNYDKVAKTVLGHLRDYYADQYGVTADSLEMCYLHRLVREFTPEKRASANSAPAVPKGA